MIVKRLGMVLALVVSTGALTYWAVEELTRTSNDVVDPRAYTLVAAAPGVVEAYLDLNAVAAYPDGRYGIGRGSGVVTSIDLKPGDDVVNGEELYSLNLRPVLLGQGVVPMFRDLALGARGPDVAQLQRLLVDRQLLGSETGTFDVATQAAVRDLQGAIGVHQDGVVRAGDIVFAPLTTPARVRLDSDVVKIGATLAGGERVLSVLATAPDFTMPVTTDQAASIPAGTPVSLVSPQGSRWRAVTGEPRPDERRGVTVVPLLPVTASSVCGARCGEVPVARAATFAARVVLVPRTRGVTVPTSALLSEADGSLSVIDAQGRHISVSVEAQAKGVAVVTGVEAGTKVRTPSAGGDA